jgi:hypothetical protein
MKICSCTITLISYRLIASVGLYHMMFMRNAELKATAPVLTSQCRILRRGAIMNLKILSGDSVITERFWIDNCTYRTTLQLVTALRRSL